MKQAPSIATHRQGFIQAEALVGNSGLPGREMQAIPQKQEQAGRHCLDSLLPVLPSGGLHLCTQLDSPELPTTSRGSTEGRSSLSRV